MIKIGEHTICDWKEITHVNDNILESRINCKCCPFYINIINSFKGDKWVINIGITRFSEISDYFCDVYSKQTLIDLMRTTKINADNISNNEITQYISSILKQVERLYILS